MIFRVLQDEYDEQAIPTDRYNAVMHALQRPISDLILQADDCPAEKFVEKLNEVLRAFMAVRQ